MTIRATYTVPAVFLIESSAGNDKGNRFEPAVLFLHGKGENSGRVVEGFDKRRVVAIGWERDHLEIEVGLPK